jgi:hypothetical protein
MPMWLWTMTLIAKRLEAEVDEARHVGAPERAHPEPRSRRSRRRER